MGSAPNHRFDDEGRDPEENSTAEAPRTRSEWFMNGLTERIIGAANEVHKVLGPGLLESADEGCLAHELSLDNISFERQVTLIKKYSDLCELRVSAVKEARKINRGGAEVAE